MAYKVNVSQINEFMRCRYRWYCKYVLNWVPIQEPVPLNFGRFLHLIFESHAKGSSMTDAIQYWKDTWRREAMETTDQFQSQVQLETLEQLADLEEALLQWSDQYEYEIPVLEAEVPFEFPHPLDSDIILLGRPDRVAVMEDRLWHIQNRGLSSSTNFGVYIDLARRSYHEHLYAAALADKYKYKKFGYGGTMFNLVRKLKYRTGKTKAKPEGVVKTLDEMFFQHPMSIDLNSSLHNDVMFQILRYAVQMKNLSENTRQDNPREWPAPNETMNGGPYGNRPDEYFRVLTGEIKLGDPRYFKKREDTYAIPNINE